MTESLVFTAGNGRSYNFDNYVTCSVGYGRAGFFGAPVVTVQDTIPFRNGTVVRRQHYGPRLLEVPIKVRAHSLEALEAEIATIQAVCDIALGRGTLAFTTPDGVTRTIVCLFAGGLEGSAAASEVGQNVDHVSLRPKFYAEDPFWSSEGNQIPSTGGLETITNSGQAGVYPTFVLSGPLTSFSINNTTAGWLIASDVSWPGLVTGQTLTIDTGTGTALINPVRFSSPEPSDYQYLSLTSSLGALALGDNHFTFTLVGGGSVETQWSDPLLSP